MRVAGMASNRELHLLDDIGDMEEVPPAVRSHSGDSHT